MNTPPEQPPTVFLPRSPPLRQGNQVGLLAAQHPAPQGPGWMLTALSSQACPKG